MKNSNASGLNVKGGLLGTFWFVVAHVIISVIFFFIHLFLYKFNNPNFLYWLTIICAPIAYLIGGTMVWGYRQKLDVSRKGWLLAFLLSTVLLLGIERIFGNPDNIYFLNVCGRFSTEGIYTTLKRLQGQAMPLVSWGFDLLYTGFFAAAIGVPRNIGQTAKTNGGKKGKKGKK